MMLFAGDGSEKFWAGAGFTWIRAALRAKRMAKEPHLRQRAEDRLLEAGMDRLLCYITGVHPVF